MKWDWYKKNWRGGDGRPLALLQASILLFIFTHKHTRYVEAYISALIIVSAFSLFVSRAHELDAKTHQQNPRRNKFHFLSRIYEGAQNLGHHCVTNFIFVYYAEQDKRKYIDSY